MLLTLSLLALYAGTFSHAAGQALQPVPEKDTQLWHDAQAAVALSNKVDFNLFGTLRLGRDITHLFDRRVGVGFSFRIGKYVRRPPDFLTLAAWYLNIAARPVEGRKGNENRLHLAATVRLPVGKFAISDRNLFERRLRFPLSSTRYRNRLQLDYPARLKDGQFGVFTSDEVFYDWSVDEFVRNRFTIGVTRRFNKYFTGDVYYMRQNDGRSRPGDLHVIGVAYRLRLL